VAIDEHRNVAARGDVETSAVGAGVRTLVLTAREDLEIARQVNSLLGA
jgi:acetate kinase